MSDAAAWVMVGGLSLAVAISLAALIVAYVRPGRPGPPGPMGPMGMMGLKGEPGVCRHGREAVDLRLPPVPEEFYEEPKEE